MNQILNCVRRTNKESKLQGLDKNKLDYRNKFNLTYLICNDVPATTDILMKNYDNIYMIGDSRPSTTIQCITVHVKSATVSESQTFHQAYSYKTVIPRPKLTSCIGKNTTTAPPLRIVYTTWGFFFEEPRSTWILFREFPTLLQHGTNRDMIVLNAGHHYRSPDAGILKNHTQTIVNLIHHAHKEARMEGANRTIPHVYVMETADENYPTSNGLFPGEVCLENACSCQAFSPGMELGQGTLDPTINWTEAWGRFLPDHEILWNVTMNYDPTQSWNRSRLVLDSFYSCIPDCYSADWRSRLTLPILRQIENPFALQVVPIWRQLVRRGIPNNVSPGDCTHKGVDVIMELNRQLFRTVNKQQASK
jgi:hypothetical protein